MTKLSQKGNKIAKKPIKRVTKTEKNQKKNGKKLEKWYKKLNAYDLALVYAPSHRTNSNLLTEIIEGSRTLMIHCFRPSESHVAGGFVMQNNIAKKLPEFDKPKLPWPVVLPEDKDKMSKVWRSLNEGFTDEAFLDYEADTHMKFQKLEPPMNIYSKGLKRAKTYISRKGSRNLMKILKEKGYEVGNMYDCGQLVKDLEEVIGGVKVRFHVLKPAEGQTLKKVLVLKEICILFDHNARKRILGKREQSFEKGSVFLFEDFQYRFGG